jgi:ankyrin repeat protein
LKNEFRYKKGELDTKDNIGNTALYYAVSFQNFETVDILLRFGADVNCKNEFGNTPLHKALMIGANYAIINILISRKANLEAFNNF